MKPECKKCHGTGIESYHDHGAAQFGEQAIEAIKCEECNGSGHASPAAAVPEGALPPLPKSHHKAGDFDSYADVYEPHEVQHIVRAAVEADRARQQEMSVRLAGAPADAPTIKGTDSNVQKVHIAGDGETLDEKAENALLWCYRRLKNSYGRLPFVEEAVAGLRERTAAAGAARQGGDGAPESGDVSADRAQQGEPVGYIYGDEFYFAGCLSLNDHIRASGEPVYRATKAAAPADEPTDLPKRLRIKAGVMARGEKIAWGSDTELMLEAADYIERAAPVPDTGTPTSGAVENWSKAIALLEEVCGPNVDEWWTLERRTRAFLDEVGAAPAHPGEGEKP